MNLNQTFSIRFWQAKSRNADGLSLIYARITINGDRIEISTNRKINAILWNAKLQKANGKSAEAQTLNNHLEAIKTSDFFHYLSIHEKLSNNTAMKYISRVKTIFILANNRGWTSTNLAGTFKYIVGMGSEQPNQTAVLPRKQYLRINL